MSADSNSNVIGKSSGAGKGIKSSLSSSSNLAMEEAKSIKSKSTFSSPVSTSEQSSSPSPGYNNVNAIPKSTSDSSSSTGSYIDFQSSGDEDFPF